MSVSLVRFRTNETIMYRFHKVATVVFLIYAVLFKLLLIDKILLLTARSIGKLFSRVKG
jgi:hypothetical protein